MSKVLKMSNKYNNWKPLRTIPDNNALAFHENST